MAATKMPPIVESGIKRIDDRSNISKTCDPRTTQDLRGLKPIKSSFVCVMLGKRLILSNYPVVPTVGAGFHSLVLVFCLAGEALDIDRAGREYVQLGRVASSDDLIRIARAHGYKTRVGRSSVK